MSVLSEKNMQIKRKKKLQKKVISLLNNHCMGLDFTCSKI